MVPIESITNKRTKVQFRCKCCGEIELKAPKDVLDSSGEGCRRCVSKKRMSNLTDQQLEHLRENARKMKGVESTTREWRNLRKRCQGAFNRCTNPNEPAYKNYGGRGISVGFSSATEMAKWIVDNLGYPSEGASLDRIDNNKGYVAGNLRWADSTIQSRNRRPKYRSPEWERIIRLSKENTDFCVETIREFVKKGMSDDEIRARRKSSSGRPRVRHP